MKIIDIINEIQKVAPAPQVTCDTVKCGDVTKDAKKIAVTMFPTVDTLREASAWGADMLLVHEPIYYEHMEKCTKTEITEQKRKIIEDGGMVIYRHHDRMHAATPDGVALGEMHYIGLRGKLEFLSDYGAYVFVLDEPITALELGKVVKERLNLKAVRIAGEKNKKIKTIAMRFGSPGSAFAMINDERIDTMLIGEVCEWQVCEYVRDAAALGKNKSTIILGHVGSERWSMRLLCDDLASAHPNLEFKYFENEEVYDYV